LARLVRYFLPLINIMRVASLSERSCRVWEDFVHSRLGTTAWHHLGWSLVFQEALGIETSFLMAIEDDLCVGILPLYWRRNLWSRHLKEKFGGRPIKLCSYTYQELKGRRTTRPTQLPKWLPVFSSVWRRLPLRFAKVLGPFFRRRMPFA